MSIRLELDRELEKRFRETSMKRFGYSKGSIKKAAEIALEKWITEETLTKPEPKKTFRSPVDDIVGLLADTKVKGKKTSVELQHESKKLWSKITKD